MRRFVVERIAAQAHATGAGALVLYYAPADWEAMVSFVARHKLKPVVSDVFPLDRAAEAFALMERGGQFGKIVVKI